MRSIIAIGVVLVSGLLLMAMDVPQKNRIGKPLPSDAAVAEKQILRIVYPGNEPRTLDATLDNYNSGRGEYLFERLTLLDEDEQLTPGAADRWEVSEDGRIWTFYLRPGAQWSDGRPVTAHDFEWTYKTLLQPTIGNVYAFLFYEIKGARNFNLGATSDMNTIGVRAVDDLTFVIETEEPCPYLPYLTSYLSAAPIPRWQFEKYGKKWAAADHVVTNASYKVLAWIPQQQMVFGLNPYYNGPYKGYLERVVLPFIAAGTTGVLAYENDEIDLLHNIGPREMRHIAKNPELKSEMVTWPHTQTFYIFFQTKRRPFNDIRMRQAIAHAIDRDVISGVIRNGLGIPAYTMLPPGFPGYAGDRLRQIQSYDPDLARRLLAEAGYPKGRGFPRIPLWLSGNEPATRDLGQAIQAMLLDNLGIQIDLTIQDAAVFVTNMYQHAIPMGVSAFQSDYPDPHNLLAMVWRSQPKGHGRHDWTDPEFDTLVDAAGFEMDAVKRMQTYNRAEEILATDAGGVFLYHTVLAQLRKPHISGFKTNKQGYQPFWWNHMTHTRLYVKK